MRRPRLKVFRSDTRYMIARGSVARIVSEADGIGERVPLDGAIRHVHVVEPWERITDLDALPAIVKDAIALNDLDDDKFVRGADVVLTQCVYCKHIVKGPVPVCSACPGSIPPEILSNDVDHRRPWLDPATGQPGDEGGPLAGSILFEPRPEIPPAALATLFRYLDRLIDRPDADEA
jgi:hypothetical protein